MENEQLVENLFDSDVNLRIEAASLLFTSRLERNIPFLLKALGDSNYTVRFYSAMALGKFKDRDDILDVFFELLKDESPNIRGIAEQILRSPTTKIPLEKYLEYLNNEDEYTRLVILGYLMDTQNPKIQRGITKIMQNRSHSYIDSPYIMNIIVGKLLDKNETVNVKLAIVKGLRAINRNDDFIVDALLEVAKSNDDPLLRKKSINALKQLGNPKAADFLNTI